jgi:hypothetical protein
MARKRGVQTGYAWAATYTGSPVTAARACERIWLRNNRSAVCMVGDKVKPPLTVNLHLTYLDGVPA